MTTSPPDDGSKYTLRITMYKIDLLTSHSLGVLFIVVRRFENTRTDRMQ